MFVCIDGRTQVLFLSIFNSKTIFSVTSSYYNMKEMWMDTRQESLISRCISVLLWLILLSGTAVNYILNNDKGKDFYAG